VIKAEAVAVSQGMERYSRQLVCLDESRPILGENIGRDRVTFQGAKDRRFGIGLPCPSAIQSSSWRRRCSRRISTATAGRDTERRPSVVFGASLPGAGIHRRNSRNTAGTCPRHLGHWAMCLPNSS
jgi:hypothetical protein